MHAHTPSHACSQHTEVDAWSVFGEITPTLTYAQYEGKLEKHGKAIIWAHMSSAEEERDARLLQYGAGDNTNEIRG